MKAFGDGNLACGIFVDLQKAFDTMDHSILLSKLCHYRIHGLVYQLFESYLANCKQFVSMALNQVLQVLHVLQGSVLGLLLFIYTLMIYM